MTVFELYITMSENLQNWTSHPLLNFLIRTTLSLSSTLTSSSLLGGKVTPSLEVMSQIALLILSWSPDCGNCGEQDSSENNLWKVIVNSLPHLPLFYFILFVICLLIQHFLLEQAKITCPEFHARKKIEISCLIGPQCSCHVNYVTYWVLSIIRDIRAVILYVQDKCRLISLGHRTTKLPFSLSKYTCPDRGFFPAPDLILPQC